MTQYSQKEWEHSKFEEPDMASTYSAVDFAGWPVGYLVELIRGKIHKMAPAPSFTHQKTLGKLFTRFYSYLYPFEKCKVISAPLDVFLINPGEDWKKAKNIVEPDMVIICDNKKITERGCIGSPDFVLEILSPHNKKKDLEIKFDLYQEYGIPEYWIIDPMEKGVMINILNREKRYNSTGPFTKGEVISPSSFPDLTMKVDAVF